MTFDCDERELFELSEELRRSVEQLQGLVSLVTISAGCCHDRALTDIETAIDKADKALYQAKERGRNNTQTYQKNEYRVAYM